MQCFDFSTAPAEPLNSRGFDSMPKLIAFMHQSFVFIPPSPTEMGQGIAGPGQGAGQLLFDCPRSAGEVPAI